MNKYYQNSNLDLSFYFSSIRNGIDKKLINDQAIIESLIALKRAGSNAIITYFALEVANQLK